MRNMGSRRHTASPGRTPVRSAVLITVASPGPTPSVDSRVLAEGFTVAEGSMAEAVFTEAEVEDSSTSSSFSHRRMEKDLYLLEHENRAPSRDGYRDFHLERKENPR